jgi:hypothetical protein
MSLDCQVDNEEQRCSLCGWKAPARHVRRNCPKKKTAEPEILTNTEARELFGDEDPTLWGNRIKALTDAIGIPPCGGCEKRRQWLNKATLWLRGG